MGSANQSNLEPTWRDRSEARQARVGMNCHTRLTLCCFAVGAVAAAASVILEHRSSVSQEVWRTESRALGESVAHALGKAGQLDLRSSERDALRQLAERSLRDHAVQGVRFLDASDQVLASAGNVSRDADAIATAEVTDADIAWRKPGEQPARIGRVEVSLAPLPKVDASFAGLQTWTYLLGGVFVLSALLATLFLATAFAPLRRMLGAAKRIANGELDVMLPSSHVPLFQSFASAVNKLLELIRVDRKRYTEQEEALKKSMDELERTLAARTAQLEAANGRLSGEIAEKEDFLRAISHDLNAPLRNIGGMITMLQTKNKQELSEEAQGRLDRIKKNVDVESDLINELLELSRIKSRQRTLALIETEALVWELRGMFENDLKTRNIELTLETSLPALFGERARIRQVFQNLIDNAIKYMGDRNTRQIRVGCKVDVAEVEFYVRDTGVGIHPEDIQKVFYVFRRGRGEITHKVPGKGVGLASVKSIVETYAGRIWVESELNEGTTFKFTINGKYVPAVSGQVPDELQGNAVPQPTLAAKAA